MVSLLSPCRDLPVALFLSHFFLFRSNFIFLFYVQFSFTWFHKDVREVAMNAFFFSFAFLCVGKHNKWKEKSTKTWGKMKQSGAFFFFSFLLLFHYTHTRKKVGELRRVEAEDFYFTCMCARRIEVDW